MKAKNRRQLRLILLRWHRRIGIAIVLVLLWVSITGIFLNHTDDLKLSHKDVKNPWLRQYYSGELVELTHFKLDGLWLTHTAGGYIYLNDDEVAYCGTQIAGALLYGDSLIAACQNMVLMLSPQGEVIERIDSSYGLPTPIEQLGLNGEDNLITQVGGQYWQLNLDYLVFKPLEANLVKKEIYWATATTEIPEGLKAALKQKLLGPPVLWEQVLLDLHSGRIWGAYGILITDAFAVLLIFLSLSGSWVWLSKPGRFRRKNQKS